MYIYIYGKWSRDKHIFIVKFSFVLGDLWWSALKRTSSDQQVEPALEHRDADCGVVINDLVSPQPQTLETERMNGLCGWFCVCGGWSYHFCIFIRSSLLRRTIIRHSPKACRHLLEINLTALHLDKRIHKGKKKRNADVVCPFFLFGLDLTESGSKANARLYI